MGFVPIDPMNVRTKFEVRALPIPEIIGGTPKIWEVHGYAQAPFSRIFLMSFCTDGPCECTGQI